MIEATLTIEPPPPRAIRRAHACMTFSTPIVLTSKTRSGLIIPSSASSSDAGVVDEHVEALVALEQLARGRLHRGGVRDVERERIAAELVRPLARRRLVGPVDHDRVAILRQPPRRGEADPARRPGDERDGHVDASRPPARRRV